MAVENIMGSEVESKVKEGITIVNVFGSWCGPCQMFAPILEDVSSDISVYKIDIDTNQEFGKKMQIAGVPSTFIYKDGILKDTITGFIPKETLLTKVKEI